MKFNTLFFTAVWVLIMLSYFLAEETYAQNSDLPPLQTSLPDTIPPMQSDTLDISLPQVPEAAPDTTLLNGQQDMMQMGEEGTRQRPGGRDAERRATGDVVNFQARDSLTFSFRGERKGALYGSANVTHESGSLESGKIDLDLRRDIVEAFALNPEDTLSYPVLRKDGQDLRSTRVLYNYKTEKGKFEVAEIEVDDGYLIGTKVKNVSPTEVFIEDGIYSSCPPDHMYYYIRAQRMKIVDEDEVFFTNARLYILDIPYPMIFPFGYIPAGIDRRRSGLLEPTYIYQDTATRGIGAQNVGWFQYFNDNLVGQTSFDLFTSGTFFNENRVQYRVTNSYNGSITIGYSREQGLEPTDLDFEEITSKRLSISHDQQLNPFSTLSANINLNTSNYFQRNSFDLDERAQTSSTSRVSYRYNQPDGHYNFSITGNLNQQYTNNSATLSAPQMDFSLRQFAPFESSDRVGTQQQAWYERITVSYRNSFRGNYRFQPTAGEDAEINWFEGLLRPSRYREATGNEDHVKYGFVQRGQVRAGQIIPSQFLNVSANLDLNEYWYPTTTERVFDPEENRVTEQQVRGFATARDFNTSLSFSTTFYGISQMSIGNFEGLRHTVRPNVSLSYRPDFSDEFWGFYEEVQVDTLGNTQKFNRFDREVFGGPPAQEQRTISFGINNVLETKRVRRDSTGEVQSSNIRLLESASINSSYNFAADSLNLGNINLSANSRVLDGISIRGSATYSPYARNENGQIIDRYLWNEPGPRILQPTNFRISASTSFRGGAQQRRIHTPVYRPYDPYDQAFFNPIDRYFNEEPVQSISAPWSLSLDFSYSWSYRFGQENQKSAILNASNIQFRLTPKWSVSTRLGYDFIEKDLTPAQFRLNRDMVCWSLSFQFNPFGDFQYYSFRLSLNSSQVQSLFQKLPGLNNLERSSSPTGRPPTSF